MSLFPEPPSPGDMAFHMLEETDAAGPLGGPSYSYRGAVIDCQKGGYICRLTMPAHPLHDHSFGVVGTITSLVDLWLDEGRLPPLHASGAEGLRRP
jgi:hypothetical protein